MKYYRIIFSLLAIALLFSSCQEDDLGLESMMVPSNILVNTDISTDGSGIVEFTVSADNAISYQFNFGDGTTGSTLDGTFTKRFSKNGLNTYLVNVIAYGTGGISSSRAIEIEVQSDFSDPETKQFLTGGSSKKWYVASYLPGHLGVGPSSGDGFDSPIYYQAAPFEKAGTEASSCFYTDVLTYSTTGEDNLTYELNNNGQTFFNVDYVGQFGGPTGSGDQCIDFDTSGVRNATLSPASSGIATSRGTQIDYSNAGFMSYYIGASSYEILSIDENSMYVRAVMGNNPALAWYVKFTTLSYDLQNAETGGGEETGFESDFDTLLWESDYQNATSLDTNTWNFEIGNNNGWGNDEKQYYTDSNTSIIDGNLLITAKRESESGFDYTSSRITTQDKFEFTYGRIEARAKLPAGAGTWPAIWLLGSNFNEVGWPETGEIDIMEHTGNSQNTIHGALHYPERSGANADTGATVIENASTEFHIYTVEWSAERIWFLVDGEVFHMYENNADSPFNKDFFLILNVAMGGTFGGAIGDDFQESSMEIDYIKVYQ
ncbi:glycosyl hydrolase family 16 [Gillisia mitskevichiae]|uniref:Glycosyl hydrolase family 16 n=1 Tax=Gillisia mitskevichiae TaxID=270921 RepID=A0A495PY50_9FLAO|nr:family 16 glycosylhydrolase [Gillisia mitskevichiae]RKS55557.1 glycosyl hydrolase family 16 [Gillisia mitskevichiae]